jgi:hypothetical protein
MDSLDLFFKKYAYKFPKGYPDMNNEHDINVLADLLENVGIDLEETQDSKTYNVEDFRKQLIDLVSNTPEKELGDPIFKSIFKRLKNYQTNILEDLKIELNKKKIGSLYKAIYNIAEEFGEADNLLNYLRSSKPDFSSLIKSNESGNLVDIARGPMKLDTPDGISEQLFRILMSKGDISIGNVNMGKGELAIIILFEDTVKESKKGDISTNIGTVEVKGLNSRISLDKRKLSSQSSKNLVLQKIGDFSKEYNITFEKNTPWIKSIKVFYDNSKPEPGKFKKDFENALKSIYGSDFNISNIDSFLNNTNIDQAIKEFQKEITLKLIEEFLESNKDINLLFFNPNGNFLFLDKPSIETIKSLLDNNQLKISTFSDELPRIEYVGGNK